MYFVSSVKENFLQEILDRRLDQKKNAKQLEDVALLALRCLGVLGEKRPTMKEVALELQNMIVVEVHLDKAMKGGRKLVLTCHVPKGHGQCC
ncbi:hypothetical protein K1719_000717 [Acacia pycnantha]|nr:hypothetical protein K1719_000717 [Acacia pycnantha]